MGCLNFKTLIALCLLAAPLAAEQVTATSFLPSPLGVFKNIRTTQDTWLAINAANNVGIGTTSPLYKLHLYSAADHAILQVEAGAADKQASLRLVGNSGGGLDHFRLGVGGNTVPTVNNKFFIYDGLLGTYALMLYNGQLSVNGGTAAAPNYTFISDLDTGIFSPGANLLALTTNGLKLPQD